MDAPATFATTLQPQLLGLVRGLPNAQYHRGPGLSNSGLKALRRSPFHYQARHLLPWPEWLADSTDSDGSSALFAGTLAHCATLEPEAFAQRYAVGPEGVSKNSKVWHSFAAEAAPRQVIGAQQYARAQAQAAALRSLAVVAEILDGGECEVSGYWRDPATGVLCRCRPDCANASFGWSDAPQAVLLDVKTTTDASRAAVRNTVARYGYHHQADWYTCGYELASGVPVAGFIFAFVESEYPFACSVVELDGRALEVAHQENREALAVYAQCERTGLWPGYPTEVETVGLPRWAGGGPEY